MTTPSGPAPASAEYTYRLNRVLRYIEHHLADDLSLAVLARESCFSSFHFHRVFLGIVGETPLTFVRRVRLEKAASLLQTSPGQSITQIGLACGFVSPAAFSRAFRDHFGMSPRDFRMNRKNGTVNDKDGKDPDRALPYHAPVNTHQREKAMHISIRELPGRHCAFVANLKGYDQEHIGKAWARLCAWAGPLGLLEQGEMIGVSFDDPEITPKGKCRYYASLSVPASVVPPRDIGVMDLAAGKYAVVPFDGTAGEIQGAYKELYASWLPQSGFEPADAPCYEIYHSTPGDDPEGHFVMDICLPLAVLGGATR